MCRHALCVRQTVHLSDVKPTEIFQIVKLVRTVTAYMLTFQPLPSSLASCPSLLVPDRQPSPSLTWRQCIFHLLEKQCHSPCPLMEFITAGFVLILHHRLLHLEKLLYSNCATRKLTKRL